MAETIYKIGNKILKIGGKLLTVPAQSFMELVNLGSTEYKRTTQGTTVEYFDLTRGASYPYMTISCDVDLYYEDGSDAEDFMLGNADAYENRWRMRAYWRSNRPLVGFVGVKSDKGVIGWTTKSGQSVGSMSLDGWTYRTISSWTKTSGYRSVKLVYDVANFKCYVYIEGTLYGYATVDYSPYTITRVSVQKEQSYGTSNYAAFKNFKIGAFQTLEDAIAY
jgi:hypothetical protein